MQRLEDRLKQADQTPLVCLHCAFSSSTCAHHKQQHYAQAKNGEFAGLLHGLTLLVAHSAHRRMTVFTHPGASMEVQLIHVPTYMLSASQVMSLLWTCNMISCTVEHAVPTYKMLPLRAQSRSVSAVNLTYPASLKLLLPSCFASSTSQQSDNTFWLFQAARALACSGVGEHGIKAPAASREYTESVQAMPVLLKRKRHQSGRYITL